MGQYLSLTHNLNDMKAQIKSFPQLVNHFQDESTCVEFLEQQRWGGTPVCPHCQAIVIYRTNRGYKCKECLKKFSIKTGTIFENSNIKLSTWFAAIYLASAHKKGISSLQLHRDLNVTQKTAWFMLHRIREMMRKKSPSILTGTIQADETFVGGKNKNRHVSKKVKESQGRSTKDKTPVFGLRNEGKVNTEVVANTKGKTLMPIIASMIERDATVVTDEWGAYNGLNKDYQHEVIKHKDGEYVRNGFHTNGIENFWSLLKRGIYGIYHSTSRKHLQRYCDEFSYRYNSREIKDAERFDVSLSQVEGGLSYKQLIKK